MKALPYFTLLFILFFSCTKIEEEFRIEDDSPQKEFKKVIIDDTENTFIFYKNKEGELYLDVESENILEKFLVENNKASFYVDKDSVVHIFKNSDLMVKYLVENTPPIKKRRIENNMSNRTIDLIPDTFSNIEMFKYKYFSGGPLVSVLNYGGVTDYQNGQIYSYMTDDEDNVVPVFYGSLSYLPNQFDDEISSIKIKHKVKPIPFDHSYKVIYVFYRNSNYGGYSFGTYINGTENKTITYSNLHKKRMSGSWWWKKYWGNRISSIKHYQYNLIN